MAAPAWPLGAARPGAFEPGSLSGRECCPLRYQLLNRPRQLVESNPLICSRQTVFRGTWIPAAVIEEQLRAGTPRQELEHDFPQLSQPAFDYDEIQVSPA